MELKVLTIIVLSHFCMLKKLLIVTKENSDKKIADDGTHYDYIDNDVIQNVTDNNNDDMADVKIQSATSGNPVELKCVSPQEFSTCFFTKTDADNFYRIRPNAKFHDKRLQCLCDVSLSMILLLSSFNPNPHLNQN